MNKNRAVSIISIISLTMLMSSPVVFSLLSSTVTISSTGEINYSTMTELHTDGKYIKDSQGNTVTLRGVWLAEYADSCVGGWGGNYYTWNEANVRADMANLRDVWKVNVINTFIWGNWWQDDMSVTLGGFETSNSYRWALKETARIAQEYGIYFQIRLWEPSTEEGNVDQPYAPYSEAWSQQDFVDFWTSVASELKSYSNVIFQLYDEPLGDQALWFEMATEAINAIRATGAQNLIAIHWGYCGDCMWMEDWIQEGRPLDNILFSNHIYRYHGTFEYDPNSATDIDYIRTFLAEKPGTEYYTGAGYKYIMDTYDVPIWVSAIGAYRGTTNDAEYTYFENTLAVLNEWDMSYCAYQWYRSSLAWYIGYTEPNRVGQAFIDAQT